MSVHNFPSCSVNHENVILYSREKQKSTEITRKDHTKYAHIFHVSFRNINYLYEKKRHFPEKSGPFFDTFCSSPHHFEVKQKMLCSFSPLFFRTEKQMQPVPFLLLCRNLIIYRENNFLR